MAPPLDRFSKLYRLLHNQGCAKIKNGCFGNMWSRACRTSIGLFPHSLGCSANRALKGGGCHLSVSYCMYATFSSRRCVYYTHRPSHESFEDLEIIYRPVRSQERYY